MSALRPLVPGEVDLEVLGRTVGERLGRTVGERLGRVVRAIDVVGRDDLSKTFSVALQDGDTVLMRVGNANTPATLIESEVATLKYIREHTSIPVPAVISHNLDAKHPIGSYLLYEKIPGVRLDTVFHTLPQETQDSLVSQLARYILELSNHTFPAIGTKPPSSTNTPAYPLGPLAHPSSYTDGRAALPLSRGPFPSTHAYLLACAQRERDAARALFTQGASDAYQRELEDAQLRVERAAGLLCELVRGCPGLEDQGNVFRLDVHEIGLKSVLVSEHEPAHILAVTDWQRVTTRPLWRCARPPSWLLPSLFGSSEMDNSASASDPKSPDTAATPTPDTARLLNVFRRTIADAGGDAYLRELDADEDMRHALDAVAEYDAFRDSFLVLPTLQSMWVPPVPFVGSGT
ncbi:hypothetical protein OF83DRAFT_1048505 [Amylostereum chailletii]|nr:hypothetical protein OF83DRAFT_1048505 [Amylostereum chailletii]